MPENVPLIHCLVLCKLTLLCLSYADILPNLLASCIAYLLMIVAIVMCTGEVCVTVHCNLHR